MPHSVGTEEELVDNYVGQFVFIERVDQKTTYGNGEYFAVQQTPHTLYAVKLVGGYGGHELHAFPLVGAEARKVISSYRDDALASEGAAVMRQWSQAPKRGEKLAWIESVYTQCAENSRMVERALGKKSLQIQAPTKPRLVSTIEVYSDGSTAIQQF